MIALRKEIFDLIRKESIYIGIMFIATLAIFKIAFYRENLTILFRFVFSLFWLFALPGYFAMLYWHEKLDFVERFVVGTALSAGLTGAFSYYLGLFGLHIKYHTFTLPVAIIIVGLFAAIKKK